MDTRDRVLKAMILLTAGIVGSTGSSLAAPPDDATKAPSEEARTNAEAEEQAVRKVAEEVAAAWQSLDAKAVAAHYAQDAEYVNILGVVLEGRDAIRVRHAEIFTTVLKGSHASFTIRHVRFPGPEVALVAVDGVVTDIARPIPGLSIGPDGTVRTRLRHVLAKRDGRWVVVSSQSTQVAPVARGQD